MLKGLFQPMHLLILVGVVLLFLGPRKLPELGKGLGEGIRALKQGLRDAPTPPPDAGPSAGPPRNA